MESPAADPAPAERTETQPGVAAVLADLAVRMSGVGSHRDPCRLPDTPCLCGVSDFREEAVALIRGLAAALAAAEQGTTQPAPEWLVPFTGEAAVRPYCLRCEVPIYQDADGVWRREGTGSDVCPRCAGRSRPHEPLGRIVAQPASASDDAALRERVLRRLDAWDTAMAAENWAAEGLHIWNAVSRVTASIRAVVVADPGVDGG